MALACMSGGCSFQAPVNFEPATAMQAIMNHLATEHPTNLPRACGPSLRPPATLCPTVDISRSPPQRANLRIGGSGFDSKCNIPELQLTTKAIACSTGKPISTADKAIYDIESLSIAGLVSQVSQASQVSHVKTVAAIPAAVGVPRSTARLAKQSSGERSQVLPAKAHGSATDYEYLPPCPYAATLARAYTTAGANRTSDDYTSQDEDIPLSSIYNFDVNREVRGTASIEGKSIHELICVVEATEAAQDTRRKKAGDISRVLPYKTSSKQDAGYIPQQAQHQSQDTCATNSWTMRSSQTATCPPTRRARTASLLTLGQREEAARASRLPPQAGRR